MMMDIINRLILLLIFLHGILAQHPAVTIVNTFSTGSLRAKLISKGLWKNYAQERKHLEYPLPHVRQKFSQLHDDLFLANVTIGFPGETFSMVISTGSSDTWVFDSSCRYGFVCGNDALGYNKKKFNHLRSETYIPTNLSRHHIVRSSSMVIREFIGDDIFRFGNTTDVHFIKFGRVTYLDRLLYENQPIDGILGLGWKEFETYPKHSTAIMYNHSAFFNMYPVFTVFIDQKANLSTASSSGQISFGAINTINCAQSITYVSLTKGWQFKMEGARLGAVISDDREGYEALVDTGSSWIGCPRSALRAIIGVLSAKYDKENDLYTVNCDMMRSNSTPPLVLLINETMFTIPATDYIVDLGLGNDRCVIAFYEASRQDETYASWILGDIFIRTYCTTFDYANRLIGFSKSWHGEERDDAAEVNVAHSSLIYDDGINSDSGCPCNTERIQYFTAILSMMIIANLL